MDHPRDPEHNAEKRLGHYRDSDRGTGFAAAILRQDQAQALSLQFDLKPPASISAILCARSSIPVAGKDDPGRKRAEARLAEVKAKLQAVPEVDPQPGSANC